MKRLFLILIVGSSLFFSGCGSNSCTYPTFPKPSQNVLNKLQQTNDKEVYLWLEELYKLKLKLEVK